MSFAVLLNFVNIIWGRGREILYLGKKGKQTFNCYGSYPKSFTMFLLEILWSGYIEVWSKAMDMGQYTIATFCNTVHSDDGFWPFRSTWHTIKMAT